MLTRTGDAAPTRQEVRVADACSDVGFANVDSNTVWLGDLGAAAHRAVVSRADAASRVGGHARSHRPRPRAWSQAADSNTDFFTAPGLPLLALGSADRHQVRAQRYDPVTQTWDAAALAYDAGARRCSWGDNWLAEDLAVIAVDVRCGGRHVVLTTTRRVLVAGAADGPARPRHLARRALRGRPRPEPYARHLTRARRRDAGAPGDRPVRRVVPDGPDGAVLLTSAGRHRGWPTVLQHSSPEGWTRLSRTHLPTLPRPCGRVRSQSYDLPQSFDIYSGWKGYTVRIVERDGEWTVRRSQY